MKISNKLIDFHNLGPDWTVVQSPYHPSSTLVLEHKDKYCTIAVHDALGESSAKVKSFSGTTDYTYNGHEYSFDRHGIESSFYIETKKSKFAYKNLTDAVNGELLRVKNRLAELDKSGGIITVPGTGLMLTQKKRQEYTARFKDNLPVSIYPSGFGTGYHLTTTPHPYSRKAPREMCNFFDVPVLHYTTIDCD
jgi:hypothetical protein